MKTKFTFLLLACFLLQSFKSSDSRTVKISGTLIDLMSEQALDSFEFAIFGGSWNIPGGMTSCTTNQNGNFSTEVQVMNNAEAIHLFALNKTTIVLRNIIGKLNVDLGKVYMAEYNNEFQLTNPADKRDCDSSSAHLEGHTITDVIMRTRTKDCGMIAKTDTTELGSSFSGVGDSICWYSFINLYLMKDLDASD